MDCNISYIHSKLRMIQRGKLRLHKSFKHKETTLRDKSKAISKSNIKTCNEKKETRKKKKKKKKEDKMAFCVIAAKPTDLHVAFSSFP